MIVQQKKNCPVCKEEILYTDIRNVPTTCYKKMCQANWSAYKSKSTSMGDKPDLKEMGIWQASKDYKKSKKK